ncbi:hypothetical protein TNCV_3907681 [Trichonephila clavipes]|nr:hypothetical protein TNCV_3907681 [Trichonephila clavipes]
MSLGGTEEKYRQPIDRSGLNLVSRLQRSVGQRELKGILGHHFPPYGTQQMANMRVDLNIRVKLKLQLSSHSSSAVKNTSLVQQKTYHVEKLIYCQGMEAIMNGLSHPSVYEAALDEYNIRSSEEKGVTTNKKQIIKTKAPSEEDQIAEVATALWSSSIYRRCYQTQQNKSPGALYSLGNSLCPKHIWEREGLCQ